MEDIVDLPFLGKCESNHEERDDLFHLERAMNLVVQLPGGSARFEVAPIEHHQVSNLVLRTLGVLGVRIAAHSFECRFQLFGGRLVYRLHPVGVEFASGVQGS